MPITIKELFPSDPLSEALEKINFNFDQLILAGGGPPGPAGPQGPQGVPGPLGTRGDHWFVGASAFGQTMDHDGGVLKVQDHFLDSLGDVYSYFDNGSTGWTATGVNLIGPMGPTGNTGGSDDVQVQAGGSGNAVTPIPNGYGPSASTVPTTLIDFWFPKNMGKNSIFVGDVDWSINYLQNFGSNSSAAGDLNSVPQLSIIQKNTNSSGLNGIMIGAMGGGYGATSNGSAEGSTGATTSAFDFVHIGMAKPFSGGIYDRMFRIKSFRQKIRIEAGGNGTYEVASPIEVASNSFSWINNANGQTLSSQTKQALRSYHEQTYTGFIGSAIEMYSKPDWSTAYATQKYGMILLQNVQGIAPSSPLVNFNPLHGFGNVHIGATSDGISPIGTRHQQALGIARPIGFGPGNGNNDAAIRFFATDFLQAGSEGSSMVGGIRPFTQSITNTSGTFSIRSIQIGSGYPITGTPTPTTQSRQVGGRIGINNHPGWNDYDAARSINFPIHFNLGGFEGNDKATSAYPGQAPLWSIEQWALGLDYDKITGGETGSRHAGWDTDSPGFGIAYGYGYTATTGGTTYTTRSIVLSSYYAGGATFNTYTGRRNPNLYMQLGRDAGSGATGDGGYGNLALGFNPTTGQPDSTDAWSKLSIFGGITIGDIYSQGWHTKDVYRPYMGITIQGAIVQGATTISGLFSTAYFGGTAINTSIGSNIKISSNGVIMGDKIVARGLVNESNLNNVPHISLPDLRTGLSMYTGHTARGYLTVPSTIPGGTPGSGPTAGSTSVAYSSNNPMDGFITPAKAFVVTSRFAKDTPSDAPSTNMGRTYTLQNLVDRGFATIFSFYNGFTTRTVRRSWLVVPSEYSTVVLDFTDGANFGFWNSNNTWTGPYTGGGFVKRYLDGTEDVYTSFGTSPDYTNIYTPLEGQWGLTIQPGRYDGQELTIIIKNVINRNSFNGAISGIPTNPSQHLSNIFVRFKAENPVSDVGFPLSSSTPGIASSLATSQIGDSLVMARDFLAPSSIGTLTNKEWPSSNGTDFGYSSGVWNLPYGSPNGSLSPNTLMSASTTYTGTTATTFSALLTPGRSGMSQAGWYTDIDNTNVNFGTGGTLLLGNGWKVINFTWLRNYTYSGGNQSTGAWVETGREVLAARGTKNYGPPII